MLKIVTLLFGMLLTHIAIAQNQPLACQTEAAAGLKWKDGRWQIRSFVDRKFILVIYKNALTIASVAKAMEASEVNVNCRINSIGDNVCSGSSGEFIYFSAATRKGGLAYLVGAAQGDQEQDRDTVTVRAFSCTSF